MNQLRLLVPALGLMASAGLLAQEAAGKIQDPITTGKQRKAVTLM